MTKTYREDFLLFIEMLYCKVVLMCVCVRVISKIVKKQHLTFTEPTVTMHDTFNELLNEPNNNYWNDAHTLTS